MLVQIANFVVVQVYSGSSKLHLVGNAYALDPVGNSGYLGTVAFSRQECVAAAPVVGE